MRNLVLLSVSLIWIIFQCNAQGQHGCNAGWSPFERSCYIYMHDKYTWFDAKVACNTIGGVLAEIGSDAENTFVNSLLANMSVEYAWIGLEDMAIEGEFVWASNQEVPEYTKWQHGEPNDYNGKEDCVVIRNTTSEWIDEMCEGDHYNFICEATHASGGIIG